jgi:hypothetical protein
LVTALAPLVGRPTPGVSLNMGMWLNGPRQPRLAGGQARLGRFIPTDPVTVDVAPVDPANVTSAVPYRGSRIRLLVIPPETDPKLAQAVLASASLGSAANTPAGMLATGK